MKTLGQIAYEAYAEFRRWTTYDNKPMPAWDTLSLNFDTVLTQEIRDAWQAAAEAVANACLPQA